jgi:hypothetical protein
MSCQKNTHRFKLAALTELAKRRVKARIKRILVRGVSGSCATALRRSENEGCSSTSPSGLRNSGECSYCSSLIRIMLYQRE